MEIIRSKENKTVKWLAALHDRKKSTREGVVFIEGVRLCKDACYSGVLPKLIVVSESKHQLSDELQTEFNLNCESVILSDECFIKVSSTVNPQGIAMVVPLPTDNKEIPLRGSGEDIFVILENIQDPGNLGTIIRLADAFDFSAVILTEQTADPYNEKVLRSSMGSVWHIPLVRCQISDALEFMEKNGITTIAAELNGQNLTECKLKLPAAYLIGNEGNGLSIDTIRRADLKVRIPMPGKAESLNAASAASIIGFMLSILRG